MKLAEWMGGVAVLAGLLLHLPVSAAHSPTLRLLMLERTVPASDAIFTAAAEPPADPAAWQALAAHARQLGEQARQLARHSHPGAADWRHWANAMRQAAVQSERAIRRQDAAALSQASDALYASCAGCHQSYLPRTH